MHQREFSLVSVPPSLLLPDSKSNCSYSELWFFILFSDIIESSFKLSVIMSTTSLHFCKCVAFGGFCRMQLLLNSFCNLEVEVSIFHVLDRTLVFLWHNSSLLQNSSRENKESDHMMSLHKLKCSYCSIK